MLRIALPLILALVLPLSSVQASELRLAMAVGKPPYAYRDKGQWRGFEYELARLCLERAGHEVKIEALPQSRLVYALKSLQFDAATPLRSEADAGDGLYFSAPFMRYENLAISRQADGYRIATIADLAPYRVLAWRNAIHHLGKEFQAHFGEAFQKGDAARYREFGDQADQYRQFWASSGSVLLVEKNIFRWYLNQDHLRATREAQVVTHHPFPANVYRVGFRDAALRTAFDRELAAIRASGEYQRIIERYLESGKRAP